MVRNQALGRVELELFHLYKVDYLPTVLSELFTVRFYFFGHLYIDNKNKSIFLI